MTALEFRDIKQENFSGNPIPVSADEVERLGKDVTDNLLGKALKLEGNTLQTPSGKHLIALLRHESTVMAFDVTDKSARDFFFEDVRNDEAKGIVNNYRVFELSDEDFKACTARE